MGSTKLLFFLGRGWCAGSGFAVFAAEALNPAGGIDQLLLASEKWVAIRADFNVNISTVGGAGIERMPAGALHSYFVISGMNSWLHGVSISLCESFDSKGWAWDSANGEAVWIQLEWNDAAPCE